MFKINTRQNGLCLEHLVGGPLSKNIFAVLIFLFAGASVCAQSLIPELVFMNPKLKTGPAYPAAGKDGAVYLFSNVGVGMDAVLTIQGRSSSQVSLSAIDLEGPDQDSLKGTGLDNAWQPRVRYGNGSAPAHSSWWMEFKISFVSHDHPEQSVSVNQFFVSGLDIDGDGQDLHEYQSYYQVHDFSLEQNTTMTYLPVKGCLADPKEKGNRFDGTIKDYEGIATAGSAATVTNFYSSTSSLVVRVGAETGNRGSQSTDRMYGLWFKSLIYDVPVNVPLPVTLVAFNAQAENSREVKLSWSTAMDQHSSHFTLERSLDGNEFDDEAVIFTDERRSVRKDYQFTDHLQQVREGLVYYRLKMVNRDSQYSYSDVVRVRIHRDQQAPNPTVMAAGRMVPGATENNWMASSTNDQYKE